MSLGKDLASLRKSQNLSLEDIQNAIKIPADILKSIEEETIFNDPSKNKTYVRSFVRSYAKVLKIEDDVIVRALDELEEGTYSGGLISDEQDTTPQPKETSPGQNLFGEQKPDTDPWESSQKPVSETPQKEYESFSKPVHGKTPDPKETSDIKNINWVDIGNSFAIDSKRSKTWVIFAVIILVVVLIGAIFVYRDSISNLFTSTPGNEEPAIEGTTSFQNDIPAAADSSALEENITPGNTSPEEETTSLQDSSTILGDTLTVVVYAAYSQLDPVRVTSDFNGRTNPFWMELGEAYYFDFRDSLQVRGQYGDLLLMFNGHVIENPRQNHFDEELNSIVITRDILSQQRYLEPAPEEFPLNVTPPDSIVYRVQF